MNIHDKGIRGMTGVEVIVAIALISVIGSLFVAKPAWFGGASKRAQNSTQSTAALIQANNEVAKAAAAQGASAAASVVKIGEANSAAPASPSKDFITSEVPVALSRLPAPDAQSLLDAERRRSAVMEGRVDEARRLYEQAAKRSEQLQAERDEALAKEAIAIEKKQASDLAIEKSAAVEHARTVQAIGFGIVAALALGLFVYGKLNSISLKNLGAMAADIRAGVPPIEALSTHTSPRHHAIVQRYAKLASELPEPPTTPTP